uniref:DUF3275 family protein n=2 Tax=Aromatoleum anaerobium TaxID=182180 RepID=A0ABX1PNT2_9RHOO
MSVTVEGSLLIKRIQSAHGPCRVGDRLTESDEAVPTDAQRSAASLESPDLQLFGDQLHALVAARQPVKLDPAIDDRWRFREQRNRLKSDLDYAFVPEEQIWYPQESERYQAYLADKAER